MRLNRPAQERKLDPRETPLSHQLGTLCAGLAADARVAVQLRAAQTQTPKTKTKTSTVQNHMLKVSSDPVLVELRAKYPVADSPYAVCFNPGLL